MNELGKRLTKSDIKLKIGKKSKSNCPMCEKKNNRESETLFKHRLL